MAQENTTISIDEDILRKGRKVAEREKRSFSSLVELLLENYIRENYSRME